jgi:hypothetical protein
VEDKIVIKIRLDVLDKICAGDRCFIGIEFNRYAAADTTGNIKSDLWVLDSKNRTAQKCNNERYNSIKSKLQYQSPHFQLV